MLLCRKKTFLVVLVLLLTGAEINLTAQTFPCDFAGSMSLIGMGDLDPRHLASADLDADGDLDAVVASRESETISIMLNDGEGNFANAELYEVVGYGGQIELADMDQDGDEDVIVIAGINVSVLINNGDATFLEAVNYNLAFPPTSFAIGDFDNDNNLDIAVTTDHRDQVVILRNKGDGSFDTTNVGECPNAIAIGDVDNDNDNDLVVTNRESGTVSVLLRVGACYRPEVTYEVGDIPVDVVLADLDGDQYLDVVVANNRNNNLSLLFNNGDGSFAIQVQHDVGIRPVDIVIADLDDDGSMDIATANRTSKDISVLLNEGAGTFHAPKSYSGGFDPSSISMGDFNGDSVVDLAVANFTTRIVVVLLGDGDGSFSSFPVGYKAIEIASGDVDGDKIIDFVVSHDTFGIAVMIGNGNGEFEQQSNISTPADAFDVKLVDLNGDLELDLVASITGSSSAVQVNLNNGDGTFADRITYGTLGRSYGIAVSDLDLDMDSDIVATNYDADVVTVYLNNGNGSFEELDTFPVGDGPRSIVAADFNGDLIPDLVTSDYLGNSATFLTGAGDGTFSFNSSQSVGDGPFAIGSADFDGDKDLDIVVGSLLGGEFSILANDGNGNFNIDAVYAVSQNLRTIEIRDLDKNGSSDLVVLDSDNESIKTFLNDGNGVFSQSDSSRVGRHTLAFVLQDLDGDENVDVIATEFEQGAINVLQGQGNGMFRSSGSVYAAKNVLQIETGLVDDDIYPDLVVGFSNSLQGVSVFFGDGSGTFDTTMDVLLGDDLKAIAITDMDDDLDLDIVAASESLYAGPGSIVVLTNDGNRQFSETSFVAGSPVALATADINGDHSPDVCYCNEFSSKVGILLNDGVGALAENDTFLVNRGADNMVTADLNGDQILDLVLTHFSEDVFSIHMGLGAAKFDSAIVYDFDRPFDVAVGDVDGDLDTDIVVSQIQYSSDDQEDIAVYLNEGGMFTQDGFYDVPGSSKIQLFDVDFDSDLDLVGSGTSSGGISISLNDGEANFVSRQDCNYFSWGVAVGSFDSDRFTDILSINYLESSLTLLKGIGDGTVISRDTTRFNSSNPGQPAFGHFNADAYLDIAIPSPSSLLLVSLSNGDGTYSSFELNSVGATPSVAATGDLNNDGDTDIVVVNEFSDNISVLMGNGDGTFQPDVTYYVGNEPRKLALGDTDGDGDLDLVTPNRQDNNLTLLTNNGDGTFAPRINIDLPNDLPREVVMGDIDGDLDIDLAITTTGKINVFRNEGNNVFVEHGVYDGITSSFSPYNLKLQDLDNDGDSDMVATWGSNIWTHWNLGSGAFSAPELVQSVDSAGLFEFADIDGDSDDDLMVCESSVEGIAIYENDGSFSFTKTGLYRSGCRSLAVVDMNNDSVLDLVSTQANFVTANSSAIHVQYGACGVLGGTVNLTPDSFLVTRGTFASGDELSISSSDNADLVIRRSNTDVRSRTELEIKSVSPSANPTSLEFTLEGSVFARRSVGQAIEFYNYSTGAWELVDERAAPRFLDSVTTVKASGNLARFVEPGTRCVRSRVRYESENPRQQFSSFVDQTIWTISF